MYAILVFGASTTFGRGDNINGGWVGRLKKYFEPKEFYNVVYNLAISGDSTKDLLKRFDVEAKARIQYIRPGDKFIIMIGIGTNDSRGLETHNNIQTPIKIFKKNILKLINKAKKYTDTIVFVGLTPVDEEKTSKKSYEGTFFTNKNIKLYNETIKQLCKKEKVNFIELYEYFLTLKNYEKFLCDGLHPTSKGYELMFKKIKSFLHSLIKEF